MKQLLTLSALALLLGVFKSQSCSIPAETVYTLQPNSVQQIYFDFTDCTVGVNSFEVLVTKPRGHNGTADNLPPGAPLQVNLVDLTTGEVAEHVLGNPFIVEFFASNVAGDLLQLTLTYTGKKPIDVLVFTSENFGGPP